MKDAGLGSNRRRFPRLAAQLNVKYKLLGDIGSPFSKEITNSIGQGGMFVRTKDAYQKDTLIEIKIELKGKVIAAKGKVRYVIPFDPDAGGVQFPGMGVQFTEIPFDDQELIGQYVETELKKREKRGHL